MLAEILKGLFSLTLNVLEEEQPFASVTITLYAPLANPERSSVISPFDHSYVYGVCPPSIVMSIAPLAVEHPAFVTDPFILINTVFSTIAVALAVHPFASVIERT